MQPLNTTLRYQALVYLLALLLVALITGRLYGAPPTTNLMLPKKYTGQEVDEQWLWSEKLDGIRGEWTGTEMLTKQGNRLDVPAYFTEDFPPFPLSGEIWGGRGTFERTSSIVATSGQDKGWNSLHFGVFDSKDIRLTIEERIERARTWFDKHPSDYAFVIEQQPVRDRDHLQYLLEDIEAGGGEGIILIRKGSKYINGRTVDVLKVKSFKDSEGVVVGYVPGKGRNRGRLGSLILELFSDRSIRFKIGTGFSDEERVHPPPIGAIVTFKYTGFYASGKPRFSSFLRVRSLTGEMR
ncbi:MAG: DNA ligase-1 [Desulforhopalus sp.]|jgi:DNA ligase-1